MGKGVHVMTFNDYLANRDAQWMGPVYGLLGLGVSHIREGKTKAERRRAYDSDITYVTAKEAGFDFLRDGFCFDQKGLLPNSRSKTFFRFDTQYED